MNRLLLLMLLLTAVLWTNETLLSVDRGSSTTSANIDPLSIVEHRY
jgi:hypothetical protein